MGPTRDKMMEDGSAGCADGDDGEGSRAGMGSCGRTMMSGDELMMMDQGMGCAVAMEWLQSKMIVESGDAGWQRSSAAWSAQVGLEVLGGV